MLSALGPPRTSDLILGQKPLAFLKPDLSKAPQFPHNNLPRLRRHQVTQPVAAIISAHALLVCIQLEHILGPVGIMLQRRPRLNQPRAPFVDEQRPPDAGFHVPQLLHGGRGVAETGLDEYRSGPAAQKRPRQGAYCSALAAGDDDDLGVDCAAAGDGRVDVCLESAAGGEKVRGGEVSKATSHP